MQSSLRIYNSLTHQSEIFEPLHPPHVGLYVCGPTVYGPAHLGHARCYITFDTIQRYLRLLGYKVRYVRNITDVGHLERDDEGLDKVIKQSQLENVEPMEVVQRYMNSYHHDMMCLNMELPHMEPQASGHIPEQITIIQSIIKQGLAYVVNGSVYFDMQTYQGKHPYGMLSGRKVEDLLVGTRPLAGQGEKRFPLDFALWKCATPRHIMRWPSPWGEGFPGWHIECTTLATKYLGSFFDIHGGGLDLLFPHHECEIAQSQAAQGTSLARYWVHSNLVMMEGKKMSKSLDNFITLQQLFEGNHPLIKKAYAPMVLRFFILQAHYRSTLNFSDQALQAAEQGYLKLINGLKFLQDVTDDGLATEEPNAPLLLELEQHVAACYAAMDDDFNTAKLLAVLFQLLKLINSLEVGRLAPTALGIEGMKRLKETYTCFLVNVLGLKEQYRATSAAFLPILVKLYEQAKEQKNYQQVNYLRSVLQPLGIAFKDAPQGVSWYHI
jgi:cysteinyl-tRNA synthetase